MDMNNKQFLPQYTLDQLLQRVCSRLPYYGQYNMWKDAPELCMRIESEPRAVDSVILMSKNKYDSSVTQRIYKYHLMLTYVYMLLYYRHRDDQIYQIIVFPELLKYVSTYVGDALKNIIQPEINKILEMDQLMEKAKAEEKKNKKPVFEYVNLGGIEMDHLFIEYNEERLFRKMTEKIKEFSQKYKTYQDEADVWYNAKRVVHTLRDIPRPECCIARAALALVNGQLHYGHIGSQIILLCVYAMVRSAQDNPHFAKFINAMEELEYKATDLEVIHDNIGEIKTNIDLSTPFDDYDYIGDTQVPTVDVFTKADVERMMSDYKAKMEEREKEFTAKEKDLNAQVEQQKKENEVLQKKVSELMADGETVDKPSSIQIANGHKTDFIKVLYAMTNKEFFVREDGRVASTEEIMAFMGKQFKKDKTIINYSSSLSTSKTNCKSEKAFYQIMLDLGSVLKKYYNENNKKS